MKMDSAPGDKNRKRVHIGAVSVAVPPFALDQSQTLRFLMEQYHDRLSPRSASLMQKIFQHPSIKQRHFAVDEPESFFREDPDLRISRFTRWSVELSARAVSDALDKAGLSIGDVSGLVVNTCTGYLCPGLSTYLIEKLGLSGRVRAYDLVGSGCGGAIPNLQVAQALLKDNDNVAIVSVSVEICSATFQMEDDLSLIVSNALFGDGAAACVLWDRSEGLELIASASRYVPEQRDAIRYVHKKGQLYNQLSTNLPHLVKKAAARVVEDVLDPQSLRVGDVRHWAIHAGGEKILNTIKSEIGLSEMQLQASRAVLAGYGNMSSPTVWFVMDEILRKGIEKGEWCIMVAFGAGLSAHSFLLRKS